MEKLEAGRDLDWLVGDRVLGLVEPNPHSTAAVWSPLCSACRDEVAHAE